MSGYVWIIDDELAISPLPNLGEIEELAKIFNGVVILIEPHEFMGYIDYYINRWIQHGVEIYYAPTPDFHPIDLFTLHRINEWIEEITGRGGRVLIHCMGGVGRSGMAAASHLIYRGYSFDEALEYIAHRRPGAPGNIGQRRVLEDYYKLLETIGKRELSRHLKIAGKYRFGDGLKHVSKTTQYIIELLDIVDQPVSRGVLIASIYHCIDDNVIEKLSRDKVFGQDIYSMISLYRKDKLEDLEPILLGLTHTLDMYRDGRLVFIDGEEIGGVYYLTLLCDLDCSMIISKARPLLDKLSGLISSRIEVAQQPYIEYV